MSHSSFVAARVSWSTLKAPLEARGGTFSVSETRPGTVDQDGAYVGEFGGATYILDGEMIFSLGSSPDLFANISKELNTLVVVFGYETVSGTYTLLAVRNGELIRYFSSSTASKRALDMGSPLPTEAKAPLASVDGLVAAACHLGLDVAGWDSHATKRTLGLPDDQKTYEAEDGPLGLRKAQREHDAKYRIPMAEWMDQFKPQVSVTPTSDGKFDVSLPMEKKLWHQRLRDWFQR